MTDARPGAVAIVGLAVMTVDAERLDQQCDDQAVVAHAATRHAAGVRFLFDLPDQMRGQAVVDEPPFVICHASGIVASSVDARRATPYSRPERASFRM